MIALSMKHVNAICHAELLIDTCQLAQGSHKLRAKIEDDLLRLAELKLFIIEHMTNQHQLFPTKPKTNGNAST